MDRTIELGKGEGRAHRSVASKLVQSTRHHSTLWTGLLYAIMIVIVLAISAKLH
jgi:hypothetical protein